MNPWSAGLGPPECCQGPPGKRPVGWQRERMWQDEQPTSVQVRAGRRFRKNLAGRDAAVGYGDGPNAGPDPPDAAPKHCRPGGWRLEACARRADRQDAYARGKKTPGPGSPAPGWWRWPCSNPARASANLGQRKIDGRCDGRPRRRQNCRDGSLGAGCKRKRLRGGGQDR